ncbi:hypothetical protein P0S91_14815 [Gloeocapsopsis dulcis]|nr:hypothetical protein [Gloeocapsopsis dulcis]WNN87592.1 hypothetical protein P0S91_14815 [Gloeocapsopsis dulcis]
MEAFWGRKIVSQCLDISNQDVCFVVMLKLDTILQAAKIMPQMQSPSGAIAGQNSLMRHG